MPWHASTDTRALSCLSVRWIITWCFAHMCLVCAAVALVPAAATPSPAPVTRATSVAELAPSAPAPSLKSLPLEPEHPVPTAPATLEPSPQFYAALHVGDAWLVLHRLAASERHPTGAVRAVPLTQGEALVLTRVGPPAHPGYTLVANGETCNTLALAEVRIELDSGDPGDHSALGPTWIADELAPCALSHQPQAPFVAIAGKPQSHSAPTLAPLRVAQRVKFDAAALHDCEASGDVVEAQLEIAGRRFAVTRVSGDPDALSVAELDGAVVLNTRAALTWDGAGVGC